MTNIILTNNKNLQLVGIRVGVLATLRIELPLVNATATDVEIIVTNATTHTAYLATYDSSAHVWACDISAAQFPQTGKQSYEVAYKLAGKQFWDGKGWIEVVEATTSGISPSPVPPPTRYVCVSVNGYTAHSLEGAIRIPKLFIVSGEPGSTEGYIEGDEILDQTTGYRWVLALIASVPTWIQVAVSLANYYTKTQTDAAINALAAYYITANAQGAAFATYAELVTATAYYSGGAVRVPTRNDYAVVLEDETHGGAEYRYIYAIPTEGGAGHWEPQYPIETKEYTALQHKPQIGGVELVGNKTLAQLGIASAADATLTARTGFSEWSFSDGNSYTIGVFYEDAGGGYIDTPWVVGIVGMYGGNRYATEADANYALANTITALSFSDGTTSFTATREALSGYNLGNQSDKPVASEAEAEALREKKYEKPSGGIPKTDLASGVQTSLGNADNALPKTSVVAPSTSASDAGKAADAKATGDALALIAPDWAQSSTYSKYDCVKKDGAYYYAKQDIAANTAWDASKWGSLANLAALAHKFLPLTGGTVTGDTTFSGNLNVSDYRGNLLIMSNGFLWSTTGGDEPEILFPVNSGTLALLRDLAPSFDVYSTYAQDALCVNDGILYRCTAANGHTGAWAAGDFAVATVEDVLAALRTALAGKASASDLRYAISEPIPLTVTSGAAATTLADRTHNVRTVAAPGTGNTTAITATLPPIVAGKSRDMFLNLTVGTQASDAGDISLSIVEPSGATVRIDIGSVEDIGIGKNEILISENALPTTENNTTITHWLVTVRHEDFAQ